MLLLKNFRIRIFIIYFPKQKCCFKNFRKKFLNEFRTKNHRFRIRQSNFPLLLRSNTNKKRHQMCNNHKMIVYYVNTQQIIVTSFALLCTCYILFHLNVAILIWLFQISVKLYLDKSKMSRRFTQEEVNLLVSLVSQNYDFLTSSLSASKTKGKVDQKWKRIADSINELRGYPLSPNSQQLPNSPLSNLSCTVEASRINEL